MTTLSHDHRLWASTWVPSLETESLSLRFSAHWAAFKAGSALKRLTARQLRDALGANAPLPGDNHVRDEFGRPVL